MDKDPGTTRLPGKYEREKFNDIFREYYPRLLAYGELFIDRDSAEDIVQDLMVYLWDNSDTVIIHTSLEAYLFRSVYRSCINRIKSDKIRDTYKSNKAKVFDAEVRYYDPEENETIRKIFSAELGRELELAINGLPEKCREVFIRSYIGNQRVREIAAELSISERTAEAHIYAALKQLRHKLRDKLFLFTSLFL